MAYEIRAFLSNRRHQEYGRASVPFPIPNEDYDDILELLRPMEIGAAAKQDCMIDEIDSPYPVLERLDNSVVNLDELDYLAKRLDGFCGEGPQFLAMAEKLQITSIKDFINLTFCCQRATVISDFSDLEQIGKDHYMNLNGGCARTEELENLDGEETARLLIDSGAGEITPYGVVYDNGMELEMSTACQFLFVLRFKAEKDEQVFQAVNRAEKTISEQGFEVRRMGKDDIKRVLGIYFEASMFGENIPDVDGSNNFDLSKAQEVSI